MPLRDRLKKYVENKERLARLQDRQNKLSERIIALFLKRKLKSLLSDYGTFTLVSPERTSIDENFLRSLLKKKKISFKKVYEQSVIETLNMDKLHGLVAREKITTEELGKIMIQTPTKPFLRVSGGKDGGTKED